MTLYTSLCLQRFRTLFDLRGGGGGGGGGEGRGVEGTTS